MHKKIPVIVIYNNKAKIYPSQNDAFRAHNINKSSGQKKIDTGKPIRNVLLYSISN